MRDSTIIYRSFYEAIMEIPEKNQAEVWSAIFEYSLNFNEVTLTGLSKTIFTLIKPQLDANVQRYKNSKKKKKKKQNVSENEAKDKLIISETEANENGNVNHNENVNNNLNPKIPDSDSSQTQMPDSEKTKRKVAAKEKEVSPDAVKFTEWVIKKIDPVPVREATVPKIAPMYDKLIRAGYTKEDIKMAVEFAVSDEFWREQFLSPMKLDTSNKDKEKFIDIFIAKAKLKNGQKPQPKQDNSSVAHLKVYE